MLGKENASLFLVRNIEGNLLLNISLGTMNSRNIICQNQTLPGGNQCYLVTWNIRKGGTSNSDILFSS